MNCNLSARLCMSFAVILVLSSCAKEKSDNLAPKVPPVSPAPQQSDNDKITPPNPQPQPTPPSTPPSNVKLPVVSFVQSKATSNTKNEVQLELQLSEASDVPVVVEVFLDNGSALYHRDFTGFKSRSASVKAETRQTVIFAPKSTHQLLPVIGVRNTVNCDTEFFVKISKNLKQATVARDSVTVSIPCR